MSQERFVVVVVGGEGFADHTIVFDAMDHLLATCGPLHVIEGGASGAQNWARLWWQFVTRVKPIEDVLYWQEPVNPVHGEHAHLFRNTKVLNEFRPALIVVFPGGPDGANMIAQATTRGVPVFHCPQDLEQLKCAS